METTIRIATWTIVAGSLLVIGRTLFVTVLPDLELPEMDAMQASGTVMSAPANVIESPKPAETLASEPTDPPIESPLPAAPEDDAEEEDENSIVLNSPG